MPEVFLTVAEAKRLLSTGEATTVNEATRMTGISRSAFYKYKDSITPFRDMKRDQVITLTVIMYDQPGSLSAVLAIFANSGANILTINQSISANGAAMVTLSIIADGMTISLEELKERVENLSTVMRMELLAG